MDNSETITRGPGSTGLLDRPLQVSLITEGTYPFHDGGVSVWCDQLVRGLAPHCFRIDAITTTGTESTTWDLPANVDEVRAVPLWGPLPTHPTRHASTLSSLELVRQFVHAIAGAHRDDAFLSTESSADVPPSDRATSEFRRCLEEMFWLGQRGELRPALLTEDAVELTLDVLAHHTPRARAVATWPPPATVADAVTTLRMLEHLLRPLSAPPPEVDLCHASSNGIGVLLAMGAKWRYGTPFLLTEHGLYLRERYIAYGPGTLPHVQRSFILGFYKLLTAAAYQMADVIAPGSRYCRHWELANGAAADRVLPVYNGIDAGAFWPSTSEPDVPTISWVGRIDPLKDVKTMLRSFAIVRERLPQARLRIFGGTPKGNEPYLEECRHLHEQLDLGTSTTFEGRIPLINDAYHAGHIVVSTSISEGFPYSVLEAMASGRAVVATDVGGVGEAVDGVGLMVPPRSPAATAEACLALLLDDVRRSDLAERGRKRVLEEFTLDLCRDHYLEIYASLGRLDHSDVCTGGAG